MGAAQSLLDRTPETATRMIALGALDEAKEAAPRLEDSSDQEALHDFRVALRRLRSFLRGYRPLLGEELPRKHRRALKDLAAGTTVARDTEVQLEWLKEQGETLRPAHRPAWSWLIERLDLRRSQAYGGVRGPVLAGFLELEPKLRRSLSRYHAELPQDERPARPFASAVAELLRGAAGELASSLGEVGSVTDAEPAHAARIAAKRLRYLLEPLRPTDVGEQTSHLVKRLKGLQDLLGQLHDAHVLAGEIAAALVETATERVRRLHQELHGEAPEPERKPGRDLRPGLLGVDERVRDRIQELFRELEADWLGDRFRPLGAEVGALADSLDARARLGLEIERKYLLRSLPSIGGHARVEVITQGWIPGETIRERLRKVDSEGKTRYLRTVKSGQGVVRVELEDETDAAVFETLWPLTQGNRVTKRRYRIPEDDRVWEIDQFLDRDLVLAEVELPSEEAAVVVPDWLKPHLVREVTGEPEYTNDRLAR